MWRGICIAVCFSLVCAVSSGTEARERRDVSEVQSKIWILLQGDKTYRYHGWNERYSNQISTAYLVAESGYDALMELILVELAPGYGFGEKLTPEWGMSRFNRIKGKYRITGSSRIIGSHSRQFEYVGFKFESRDCFGLSSTYGALAGDNKLEGTVGFGSFYCAGSGEKVTDEAIREVIDNIGVKAAGAPVPR